jgi:uncharacterized protein YndB with AHSA1/START domain
MLSGVVIVILVVIAAILLIAAIRPSAFEVKRSIAINASPERVFPLIDDFNAWRTWSPYETKDPNMQRAFSGSPSGTGAVYAWDGHSQVGKGSLEIVESVPPSRVAIKLDMVKPIEGHNVVNFTLKPQGEGTLVTWAMRGSYPFISRLIGLFMNMDRMIGGDFETGLANLKTVAER